MSIHSRDAHTHTHTQHTHGTDEIASADVQTQHNHKHPGDQDWHVGALLSKTEACLLPGLAAI